MAQVVKHELPFRIPATFVVECILFHSDLAAHLVLLAGRAEGRLPLVLGIRRHHILIIIARHSLTIGHLHCRLPPLRGGLPLLAVTRLLLGL